MSNTLAEYCFSKSGKLIIEQKRQRKSIVQRTSLGKMEEIEKSEDKEKKNRQIRFKTTIKDLIDPDDDEDEDDTD